MARSLCFASDGVGIQLLGAHVKNFAVALKQELLTALCDHLRMNYCISCAQYRFSRRVASFRRSLRNKASYEQKNAHYPLQ